MKVRTVTPVFHRAEKVTVYLTDTVFAVPPGLWVAVGNGPLTVGAHLSREEALRLRDHIEEILGS